MSGNNRLFRQQALDRLSSPEQLDEVLQVTNPRSWLALAGVGLLLATALAWGIWGSVPKKVRGEGMLIRGERLFKISSPGNGQLIHMNVVAGTVVTQGQVVASIERPQLVEQIHGARTQLEDLRSQHTNLTEFEAKDTVREIEMLALRNANLQQLIRDYEEQATWLKEKMTNQEQLLERGLITKQTLLITKQSFYSAQQQIDTSRRELKELGNKEFQLQNQKQQGILASQLRLNEQARRLKELETELQQTTKVTSPQAGRILEAMAKPGDVLNAGMPLFNVELTATDLEAVIYLNGAEGKQVRPGMAVQIMPAAYRKEEHGFLAGKARYVADFPATRQAMMSVLENEQLVQKLSASGAPITLHATLEKDPRTPSGFRWSSSQGPPSEIHSGTLCSASIVVSQQRPITLVIPLLKELFGIRG
jgi:HlyD family secretion protein